MTNTVLICGRDPAGRDHIGNWLATACPDRKLEIRTASHISQTLPSIAAGDHLPELVVMVVERPQKRDESIVDQLSILQLLGISSTVLAVTGLKPDDRNLFSDLSDDFAETASRFEIENAIGLAFACQQGTISDSRQEYADWTDGQSWKKILASLPVTASQEQAPLRFGVQNYKQTDAGMVAHGMVLSGCLTVGKEVVVCPADRKSEVLSHGDIDGKSATVTLTPGTVLHPGDIIGSVLDAPEHTDQFAAHILWLDQTPLLPERQYSIKAGAFETTAQVTDLKHKLNPETSEHVAAKVLSSGEIGLCNLSLNRDMAFDEFEKIPATGSFVLLDKSSGKTAGFGVVRFGLRRATNLSWQETKLDKTARALLKGQKPCILWFTGFSGAGKSAAADRIEQKLKTFGHHTYLLDGDNVRHGLNRDLGFTDQDRVENIRRVAEVARLMADAGLIVLVSFISPFRSERRMARELMDDGEFIEVFMDTPLSVCEARDPKGLYQKARAGQIKNFTGIDSDYEPPELAELTLQSHRHDVDTLADQVIEYLQSAGKI